MSSIIGTQRREFKCRKCGREQKANFTVPYPIDNKYAAKCVGMKNTRWGAQCLDEKKCKKWKPAKN